MVSHESSDVDGQSEVPPVPPLLQSPFPQRPNPVIVASGLEDADASDQHGMKRCHSDPLHERLRVVGDATPKGIKLQALRLVASPKLGPQRCCRLVFCRSPVGEPRSVASTLVSGMVGASTSAVVAPEVLVADNEAGGDAYERRANTLGVPVAWGLENDEFSDFTGSRSRSAPDLVYSSWQWAPWREHPLPSGLANTLMSTLGSVPFKAPTPTFFCPICLENVTVAKRATLDACCWDTHATCQDCLRTYLELRVNEGRVDDLRCPCSSNEGACGAAATRDELKQLLAASTFEKFERFSLMRSNPQLRACPLCQRLRAPEMKDDAMGSEVYCSDCDIYFCYYHSNAHARGPEACAEYERSIVRQQLLDAGMYGAKACPRCGAMTQKASGCNHMTCRCSADWCWVCRRQLSNVGWHYNPANPNGCMQFQDELTNRREGILMVICKIISLPAMLCSLVFLIAFATCMAVTFFVPLVFCFREFGCKVWIWIAASIVGVPFLLFCIAWGVLGVAFWLAMVPCGAGEVHLQFFVGVPLMTNLAICVGILGPGRGRM
eukprot:TRINITY_DN11153_c1_g1_i1.p1 TRINITY_DN11153_c1_g1~~TRINITY_DN11153_c1_g1_i1.p1  ORF type:complete len:550 (-),score=55.40 TRINITY_DN11153_c1_g1_i1:91-1740(-)